MNKLEEVLFDIRNGMVGYNFSTRALREARKLKLAKYDSRYGEIKLTEGGWKIMHELESQYK